MDIFNENVITGGLWKETSQQKILHVTKMKDIFLFPDSFLDSKR